MPLAGVDWTVGPGLFGGRAVTAVETGAARARRARSSPSATIHTVECAFADTWGILRGKRIPAGFFAQNTAEQGLRELANAAFIWDLRCEIFDVPFANPDTGYPDMHRRARPRRRSAQLTWRDGTALVMCDCINEATHEPVALDPRHLLRPPDRAARGARLRGDGRHGARVLPLHAETGSRSTTASSATRCTKGAELEHVMVDIRRKIEAFGIVVEACNTEYGPAQIEVNLGHGAPLRVADDTVIFKYVVKEIARQHGRARDLHGQAVPGLLGQRHAHPPEPARRTGATLFAERPRRRPARQRARCATGWPACCATPPRLTLLGRPTINAYKRFEDYSFAPISAELGPRQPRRGGALPAAGRQRQRASSTAAPPADANPYLVIAAMLAAGSDGLESPSELQPMCEGNGYTDPTTPPLARNLAAAIEAYDGSALGAMIGDVFTENFLVMARHEAGLYDTVVTDWEVQRYAEYA